MRIENVWQVHRNCFQFAHVLSFHLRLLFGFFEQIFMFPDKVSTLHKIKFKIETELVKLLKCL